VNTWLDHLAPLTAFRIAVWLCPVAFTLHVLEELPHFTQWVQRNVNPYFTYEQYLRIHISGILLGIAAAALVSAFPSRPLVLLYFTLLVTPGFLWNIAFHAGSTLVYGARSPGLVTALFLYPPLYVLLSRLAIGSGLLSGRVWLVSTLAAGLFHALEVRANVFRFGRP
jgi:uncharacterized protein with HXXEE motif